MNEKDVMEDAELEKVLQNMSVDDFVELMLVLKQEEEEDDFYQVCPMDSLQDMNEMVFA